MLRGCRLVVTGFVRVKMFFRVMYALLAARGDQGSLVASTCYVCVGSRLTPNSALLETINRFGAVELDLNQNDNYTVQARLITDNEVNIIHFTTYRNMIHMDTLRTQ